MAIWVTGDIHGDYDIHKLSTRRWPEGHALSKSDYLVILGDFGLFWDPSMPRRDTWWLDWLEAKPWATLFVDGNHENHDLLAAMPDEAFGGSDAGCCPRWPSIKHLRRGRVYDIPAGGGAMAGGGEEAGAGGARPRVPGTVRVLAFGGARSHDIRWRKEGRDWWPNELPGPADHERAKASLDACGWSVDHVLTHDCPTACKPFLLSPPSMYGDGGDAERWSNDRLNGYLDEIAGRLDFRGWWFGHYHANAEGIADGRYNALYDRIVRIA